MPKINQFLLEEAFRTLGEELLRQTGEMRFVALGLSMLPAIYPGDVLVVQQTQLADVAIGDVVLFARSDQWFAHRVIRIMHGGLRPQVITQGDALTYPDAPISDREFLGRVILREQNGEAISVSRQRSLLERAICAAVRHVPLFVAVLLRWQRLRPVILNLRPTTNAPLPTGSQGPR